ncbi:hypothetical protein BDV59DRAFT_103379 [Aspergillus ambiguus]|uniref:uncharacterized protein n=1 Tax=Aspergillus ambiguus TaxID=176160 RepID=UPI003CCCCD24
MEQSLHPHFWLSPSCRRCTRGSMWANGSTPWRSSRRWSEAFRRSSSNCYFRVVCRANKNSTYISSLQDSHSCRRNGSSASKTPVRSEVSHVRFLLAEIPKLFDMSSNIKAQDVVDAVKRYHGYQISMRQAQRALIRLQQKQPQGQGESAEIMESSGDDHQESQLPVSGEQAEGSAYSSLSGQRWLPENIQSHLIDNSIQQVDIQRNPALQPPSLQPDTVHLQSPHPVASSHVQHQPDIQPQGPSTLGSALGHQTTPHPSLYAVPTATPTSTQAGQHRPQRPLPDAAPPSASQLLLTNFKIEFTCTTCGAFNQSFFPNHGNVTGGGYLPPHAVANQPSNAEGTGPSAQTVQGNNGGDRVGESHGYGADATAGTRGVRAPWGIGGP